MSTASVRQDLLIAPPAAVVPSSRLALVEADASALAGAPLDEKRAEGFIAVIRQKVGGTWTEQSLKSAERVLGALLGAAWLGMWVRIFAGG